MITLIFFKVAVTASIVFALMCLIEDFCNHENKSRGVTKHKVPDFVAYVGGASLIIAVVCYVVALIIALIMAVWL
jgi:hypothetical protein